MKTFSVKKLFLSLCLVACTILSACSQGEFSETTTSDVGYGTVGGTLITTGDTSENQTGESSASTVTNAVVHAATWSLGVDVDASDKIEYELPEPDEIFAESDIYYNYLSGVETEETDTLGIRRVTAVAINNVYTASKFQCGTAGADVIFEIPLDYGTTTLLALYYHPSSIAKLGAVRSAIPAAIDIAAGYDAYLLHNGTLNGGAARLEELGLDHLDAENDDEFDCFYSDSSISAYYSFAYSMFTTSGRISKSLLMLNGRGAHFITDELYREPLKFCEKFTTPIGNSAKRIRVYFGGFQPYFLYNSNTGLYERYQHGAPHVDLNSGETLAFENVIVMYTDTGYTNGTFQCNVEGFGTGVYASGGKYVNINWSKSSPESPLMFFDALGNVLEINKGHTFITLTSSNADIR